MSDKLKLFMVLLGSKPKGRFTEQHDVFFGIGDSIKNLIPKIKTFWPEADGKIHIDVWREVTSVNGFKIEVVPKNTITNHNNLFFINLGGYKQNEFEEYHYRMLVVGEILSDAIKSAKQTAFYKHSGLSGAVSHIDDKFGIDADDIYNVADILNKHTDIMLHISKADGIPDDELHIGYLTLAKIT